MEVACGVELQELGNTVTAVCPFWIKDTEFVTRARETDKHNACFDMPGATAVDRVVRKSMAAAKGGTVVFTPDPVSFMHRILASLLPHWLLSRICK